MTERADHLGKFFGHVLSGKKPIKSSADCKRFLEAIYTQSEPISCIERLVASTVALDALHKSLRFDVSANFLNGPSAKLHNFLKNPDIKALCNGQFLHRVLSVIVDPPTLWTALLDAQKSGTLEADAIDDLAWLVLEFLTTPSVAPNGLRDTAQTLTDYKAFLSSPSLCVRNLGENIKHILATTTHSLPQALDFGPGGRHDNDFIDFRQISILPTADELASTERPFYRRADSIEDVDQEQRPAIHLDNQFRLLREDMLDELRTDLQIARGQKKGRRRNLVLTDLVMQDIECGTAMRRQPCGLSFACDKGIPQLARKSPTERKDYVKNNRKFLAHDSFGCLLDGGEVIAFGHIDRNEDLLAKNPPTIIVRIPDGPTLAKALLASRQAKDLRFVQVDTPMFAYKPILACLQGTMQLPFVGELFGCSEHQPVRHPQTLTSTVVEQISNDGGESIQTLLRTSKKIQLDNSQLESLIAGLSRTVSLIQGPPGTSKDDTDLAPLTILISLLRRYRQIIYRRAAKQSYI